jgi:hypothetical protein
MSLFSRPRKIHVLHIGLTPQSQVELCYAREDESGGHDEAHGFYSPADIGAPSEIAPDTTPTLKLPPAFRDDLKRALAETPKTTPLWLRFSKPYGYLGAQPWEGELIPLLSRPVLRLPELYERSPEKRQVLEAAICYDAAPRAPPEKVEKQIETIAAALASSSPRAQTRIHLFPSAIWHERARDIQFDPRVVLHDPATAPAPAAIGPLFGKWAGWLLSALDGRSLDAVHMVCRAECTDIGPILSVSGAPNAAGQNVLCAVDTLEFGAFLTRVGAWMAIFTPPPGESGGAALALAADALPQLRPTVSLFQPMATADDALALQNAFAFAMSSSPAEAPKVAGGFLSCPPGMVAGYDHFRLGPLLDAMRANMAVIDGDWADKARALLKPWIKSIELRQTPNWASAVQRHVETLTLEELRGKSKNILLSSSDSLRAQFDRSAGAAEDENAKTLEEIQKIVADHLKKS